GDLWPQAEPVGLPHRAHTRSFSRWLSASGSVRHSALWSKSASPNNSRRERGGAAILPVKLVSQKTGSIACLEHSPAWACSLKALTAGSSLRAWESCFEATILKALQGTRVSSLMTARGGPGDSLAIA